MPLMSLQRPFLFGTTKQMFVTRMDRHRLSRCRV